VNKIGKDLLIVLYSMFLGLLNTLWVNIISLVAWTKLPMLAVSKLQVIYLSNKCSTHITTNTCSLRRAHLLASCHNNPNPTIPWDSKQTPQSFSKVSTAANSYRSQLFRRCSRATASLGMHLLYLTHPCSHLEAHGRVQSNCSSVASLHLQEAGAAFLQCTAGTGLQVSVKHPHVA